MFNQAIIVGVGANPEPNDSIAFEHAEGSVVQPNPRRIHGPGGVNELEMKAGVVRVLLEKLVSSSRLLADISRQ